MGGETPTAHEGTCFLHKKRSVESMPGACSPLHIERRIPRTGYNLDNRWSASVASATTGVDNTLTHLPR